MTNRKLVAGAAALALVTAGGVAAVSASGDANAAATDTAVVKQKWSLEMKPNRYVQDNMRFNKDVYRVNEGGTLKVVNTQPEEGPHTVSLVKKKDLPKTVDEAFNNCKVCNKFFEAHGADPNAGPDQVQVRRERRGAEQPGRLQQAGRFGRHRGQEGRARSRST